ncbi:MAG TPA: hypothetical protein VGM14_23710 [Streptosporangiaceae bacterium]|jgi:hypothetical protein
MSASRPGFRLDPLPDLDAVDDEFRRPPVRRRALGIAVSLAVVLGGGAVAGWQFGWPSVVFGGAADPAALVPPRSSPITVPLRSPVAPQRTRSSSPKASKPAVRRTVPASRRVASPSPTTSAPASPVTNPVTSPGPVVSPSPVTSPSPTPSPTAPPVDPAFVVEAYFSAINAGDYLRAWQLGGDNAGPPSLADFEDGYRTTANDVLQILSVDGAVVSAKLQAEQTDGSVITYQGTYTVQGGAIVAFDVQQVG